MADPRRTALIVEDDAAASEALAALLEQRGWEVASAGTLGQARESTDLGGTKPAPPDVVLLDLGLPDGDGMDLLRELSAVPGHHAVVVITGETRVERAVEAMRLGAVDYLSKPLRPQVLRLTLDRLERTLSDAEHKRELRRELAARGSFEGMIGGSAPMRRVYELVERAAPSQLPIFVRGESGTGKELLARAIHQVSRRRHKRFVAVNCGAIPENLVESELFGHEKGAFTGATTRRRGVFEQADGGTLLLDELAEMPMDAQVALLRVLEQGVVRPLGGGREVEVDVRVVAATNRNPEEAVEEGRLRADLFYRLHVFPIALPPLRDRGDDVEHLAKHFATQTAKSESGRGVVIGEDAMQALREHDWPGNVRELKNVMSRAWLLAGDGPIRAEHLGLRRGSGAASAAPEAAGGNGSAVRIPVGTALRDAERMLVEATLNAHGWHRESTSRDLGITPKTLYNKIKAWGLEPPD